MDTLIASAFFAAIGIFFAYKFAALFLSQTDMLYSDYRSSGGRQTDMLYSDYRSSGGRGDMRRFAKKLRKKKLATVALSLAAFIAAILSAMYF